MQKMLLTRPETVAQNFAEQVEAACPGEFEVITSPLMEIRLEPCSVDIDGAQALLFTSRNGVGAFASRSPDRTLPALCVGEATARDARSVGFSSMSANGAVAELAALAVQSYIPDWGKMIHFRGSTTTGDLVQSLRAEGVEAEDRIIYDQVALSLSREAAGLVERRENVVVPMFSPRTARIFRAEVTALGVSDALTIIAFSEAVAAELTGMNCRLFVIAQPNTRAMLDALARF